MAAKKKAKKPNPIKRPAKRAKSAPSKGLSMSSASPSFTVGDVHKSLAWYRDVLGFAVGERWENKGELMGVELKAGNVSLMIGQDDWKKGRDRKKGEGVRIYCTTTQDVDSLAAGIKARGGNLDSEPQDQPWGSREFSLTDPDGFKISIAKETKKR
jgi:uncharacterized glyoxalase superfamily protein PhnB